MKDLLRLVVVLTLICLTSGALLGWVNGLTREPILEARRAEKLHALHAVLPAYDNEPDTDAVTVQEDGQTWTFYVARLDGRFVGAAFETVSPAGYGGDITVMVGVNSAGTVQAIEILSHKETPGLGARITEPAFKALFSDRAIVGVAWAVKKDQGAIDEITAATISSRAVVEAVKHGLDVYLRNEDQVGI